MALVIYDLDTVIYDLATIASGVMTVIFIAILIDAIKNEFF